MAEPNKILVKMLDRLLAGLVNGPSLNCRPYASRQRLDLVQLSKLNDVTPEDVLRALLDDAEKAVVKARVPLPKGSGREQEKSRTLIVAQSIEAADEQGIPFADGPLEEEAERDEKSPEHSWLEQQAVLNKLHTIAEDARTYEQDTGVSVLNIGFPLLSLPPGTFGGGTASGTRRVLAPLAFIPVSLTVKRGAAPAIELQCKGQGVDRVMPNVALFGWLEQQTGKSPAEHDEDHTGVHPWLEICEIVRGVCAVMDIAVPEVFIIPPNEAEGGEIPASTDSRVDAGEIDRKHAPDAPSKAAANLKPVPHILQSTPLQSAPKSDQAGDAPAILCSAVLGLFPMANQGLLRDTQAMVAAEKLTGPVESFISLAMDIVTAPADTPPIPQVQLPPLEKKRVVIAEERFITGSDPCQGRAVRLARECQSLVIHGPPGTGKSQTISNIIGDHLSRGQRVLVVCDKRTALDVVFNRLNHMGLGNFCALVHDPRRDQRELYKSIRQQLDELHAATSDARAETKLAKSDAELQLLHDELWGYRDALARRQGDRGLTFHDLVGQWLSLNDGSAADIDLPGVNMDLLDAHLTSIKDVLQRGEKVSYGINPWVAANGIRLADFLAQPMDKIRSAAVTREELAVAADATIHPSIPPFAMDAPLVQQGDARKALAPDISGVLETTDPAIMARWANEPIDGLTLAKRELVTADPFIKTLLEGPLDPELLGNAGSDQLELLPIADQLLKLSAYEKVAGTWHAFFPTKVKSEAAAVANSHGIKLSVENLSRLSKFLIGLHARIELSRLCRSLVATPSGGTDLIPDAAITQKLNANSAVIELMLRVQTDSGLAGLADLVRAVFEQLTKGALLLEGLQKSPARATALQALEDAIARSRLFNEDWIKQQSTDFRSGMPGSTIFTGLREQVDALEGVLRVQQGLRLLPAELQSGVGLVLKTSIEPDRAMTLLRREALAAEISSRLMTDPQLQEIDAHRLETAFVRYRELDEQKRTLTRDAIKHRWISRQKERMLVGSGTRLNPLGTELGRRLITRGERAMRLRQVIEIGSKKTDGGDPLFDVCPIWLCSPETVAQIFPREAVFDVLVFDEASQMRLEESLPVLLRGKRVVIAGDPKQLPPTRFFESAVAASDEDDAKTDQNLFEQQQGEVEDLLGAALGLDIQQCYLDVHYRSRHADLIAFSNEHFYGSRLQPIPAHPSAYKNPVPAVVLEQVGGIYDRRRNEAEAERIVKIVKEMLSQKEPPSIGIACFNLVQRDLVVEKLDELAAEDAAFGKRLEKARNRQGEGSFEGLFVKNLENVQGDERDCILISTTYGPDRFGKFYRRFGPLGRAGGARRLNVLITRARETVHVITSIPRKEYFALPQPDEGQTPGGTWLLFAYLKFAEQLQSARDNIVSREAPASTLIPISQNGDKEASSPHGAEKPVNEHSEFQLPASDVIVPPPAKQELAVNIMPTQTPSVFSQALAQRLFSEQGIGSDVHWGNEGFCVDLALRDPHNPQDVMLGVLCDAARFTAADDAMQWDIFRTGILESQGWTLHRVWTPHFYRDPKRGMRELIADAEIGESRHVPGVGTI